MDPAMAMGTGSPYRRRRTEPDSSARALGLESARSAPGSRWVLDYAWYWVKHGSVTSTDPQMLKGVLGLLLLSALASRDHYGYGLVTQLHAAGFEDLAEGTVYPGLTRLESGGFLESYLLRSTSGPARKYYRITDSGRSELDRRRQSWTHLVHSVAIATSDAHQTGEPA